MDFLQIVTDARSCRRFDASRPLGKETLKWLVNCARLSPSAGNLQPLRYITVESAGNRAAFYPSLRWAAALKDWGGPIEEERPTGYIVMLTPKKEDHAGKPALLDTGIAAQTIQLAAASKGIAACMFLSFNPKVITEALPLPEGHEILLAIALGYPVEERRIVPLTQNTQTPYYRDGAGVHYVPKRTLQDVLLGEF